jgi:hypothetical protein
MSIDLAIFLLAPVQFRFLSTVPLMSMIPYCFAMGKKPRKYSTPDQEHTSSAAELARKLLVRCLEVRLEEREPGLQVTVDADRIYATTEDFGEARLRETNFLIAHALAGRVPTTPSFAQAWVSDWGRYGYAKHAFAYGKALLFLFVAGDNPDFGRAAGWL